MRILVVAHDSGLHGGANRSLISVLKGLKNDFGVESEVIIPHGDGELHAELDELGIKFYKYRYIGVIAGLQRDRNDLLRYLKVFFSFFNEFFLSKNLARQLKEKKYDLVYTNTRIVALGAYTAKNLKIPHVIHIREFGPERPLWGFWHQKRISKLSDKIISISYALKKTFERDIPHDKLVVIHNGIDAPVNVEEKSVNGNLNILISGSLMPEKGQLEAIKAIGLLKEQDVERIRLFIAGSSSDRKHLQKYKSEMDEAIVDLDLKGYVDFLGEIKDMDSLRKTMDIELICSKEAFGRVTVEAMRSQLLAIGANVGATPEIIEDGITGLLYEHGNSRSLADKIKFAYKNKESAEEIALNGRIFSENNFTTYKNVKEIFEVFENVLSKREF